jgi:glyoxylase-like metal-dependent hydrolase (beta-lactamase superfamily II)
MPTQHAPSVTTLASPFPGLHATPPTALPFAPSIAVRAFVLERPHGNLLVYGAPAVPAAAAGIDAVGGAAWQYLGHWHEAMFAVAEGAAALGATVLSHLADRDGVARAAGLEPLTFAGPHDLGEGFEIVPIPGHTPGATAYLWDHGDHRFLFTGDSVYLRDGEWVAAVLDSSDRAEYFASLELLRELDFDVLVPWAASAGGPSAVPTGRADAQRRLDAILRRLDRGEDH